MSKIKFGSVVMLKSGSQLMTANTTINHFVECTFANEGGEIKNKDIHEDLLIEVEEYDVIAQIKKFNP